MIRSDVAESEGGRGREGGEEEEGGNEEEPMSVNEHFLPSKTKSKELIQVHYCKPVGIKRRTPAVITCHPYAPLGGSMDDHVVLSLQAALHKKFRDWHLVTFNFRGAGKSQGRTSWSGIPEQGDLEAVIGWAMDHCFPAEFVLVGYSYGASIVSKIQQNLDRIAHDLPPIKCIFVSPLVSWSGWFLTFDSFPPLGEDQLAVYGDHDAFTTLTSYKKWVSRSKTNARAERVEGADHFWRSRACLQQLCTTVVDWLEETHRSPTWH